MTPRSDALPKCDRCGAWPELRQSRANASVWLVEHSCSAEYLGRQTAIETWTRAMSAAPPAEGEAEAILRDWVAYVERAIDRYGQKSLMAKERVLLDRANTTLTRRPAPQAEKD